MIFMSSSMFNAVKSKEDRLLYEASNNGSQILNLIRYVKSLPHISLLDIQLDPSQGGYCLTLGADQTGSFDLSRAMRKVSRARPAGPEKIRVQPITFYYCGANDSDDLDVCSDFMDITHTHNAFRVWFKEINYLAPKLLRILENQKVEHV